MDIERMIDLCGRAADIDDQIAVLEAEQLALSQRNVDLNVELSAFRSARVAAREEAVVTMVEETGFKKQPKQPKNDASADPVDTPADVPA